MLNPLGGEASGLNFLSDIFLTFERMFSLADDTFLQKKGSDK